jgi:isopenicillin N synthase-like dioxygenase/nicotinamidase-related amidase
MATGGISIANCRPIPFICDGNDANNKTALLMIDFQGDFCDDEDSFLGAMGAPANLPREALLPARDVLLAARRAGIRIIHTLEAHLPDLSDLSESKFRRSRKEEGVPVIGEEGGNGRMLTRGSSCNGLRPEVAFQDGEVAIHKPGKGAFCDTELRAWLEGVTHLIFCGVTTECCIQSTMREANDRGFDCVIVEDATASCVPSFKTETIEQLTAFGAIVACAAQSKYVVEALDKFSLSRRIPPSICNRQVGLPVIDVSPLMAKLSLPFADARRAVDADCLRCAREIDAACRRVGFFYVLGHGITPPLDRAKQLFSLDLDTKMTMKAGAGEGAGYEPSGAQVLDEGRLGNGIDGTVLLGDRKESYIIGKTAPSQRFDESDRIEGRWPGENGGTKVLPGFKEDLVEYHDCCENFLRTLLRGTALGLGLAADTFDCFTKDAMSKVRLLRYPAYAEDPEGYANALGCGTHTDWGAYTLLAQDDVGGLEVYCEDQNNDNQQWLPAPNIEGALLVNVGDMLKLWTGGRYRSAPHRVMKPGIDSEERHSIAMFYNCDPDSPIDPRFLIPNKEGPLKGAQSTAILTAEEYILERVKGTYT